MHDENPYSPPTKPVRDRGAAQQVEGSFGLGLFLGLLFGLWGWLGCLLLAKSETKRGAMFGFLGRIVAAIVIMAILLLSGS